MAQVVREAKIIVHLETGKVELKTPDLSALLKQQEQQLQLTKQIEAATRALAEAQERLRPGGGGPSFPGSPFPGVPFIPGPAPGSAPAGPAAPANDPWSRGLANLRAEPFNRGLRVLELQRKAAEEAAEAQRRLAVEAEQAAARQAEAQQRLAAAQRAAFEGYNQATEGLFRLGRAAVLLGTSSDDSFQRMIKNLALVQAGFDLFRGTTQIVLGIQKAMESLTAAQQANAVATGAAATANRTLTLSTGGLMTALNPILATLAVIGVGYALWRQRTDEQAQAERNLRDAIIERHRAEEAARIDAFSRLEQSNESLGVQRRNALPPHLRLREISQELARLQAFRRDAEALAGSQPAIPENRAQAEFAADIADIRKRELELEREKRQIMQDQAQERARAIDDQRQIVEGRRRELELAISIRDAAKKQVEDFQAQFGSLTAGQRSRLENIADKIRRGEELTRAEERRLQEIGGGRGEAIVRDIRRRRGVAEGADDVFRGIRIGDPGLEGAQREVEQASRRHLEAIAEFTRASVDTQSVMRDFFDGVGRLATEWVRRMETIEQRTGKLETAMRGAR